MNDEHTDVIIVGGGPVGLFLACLLLQKGVSCAVLERREEPSRHTRSLGIHPPALERLAEVGIAEELIERAVQITGGQAFAGSTVLGSMTFESCPPPYRFILALPQFITEAILERRLEELDASALLRGTTVTEVTDSEDHVVVLAALGGQQVRYRSTYVVGCDGFNSQVRRSAKIDFPGGKYTDTYVMGDFEDESDFGSKAGIFLTEEGVVESFPLPGSVRRWVAKTKTLLEDASPDTLAEIIRNRTGFQVQSHTCSMISAFSVYHHLATRLVRGRILLAGDAAHVVSPIGGQGMNLGWLGAWTLSTALAGAVQNFGSAASLFDSYSDSQRRAAITVRKRSEFNMWMAREGPLLPLKRTLVKWTLDSRVRSYFAKMFTMRGIQPQ